MNSKTILQTTSLVSLLLTLCHLTSDVLDQAPGHVKWPIPVIIYVVWLYGTLMLSERVAGYIIMFLGGLIAAGMIVLHSPGTVVGKSGGFFFVWTMFMLGMTGWFTAILAARELWRVFRTRSSTQRAS